MKLRKVKTNCNYQVTHVFGNCSQMQYVLLVMKCTNALGLHLYILRTCGVLGHTQWELKAYSRVPHALGCMNWIPTWRV